MTSAYLGSSGKVKLAMQSLKMGAKGSTHTSEMDSRAYGGIFLSVVAILGFTFLSPLSMVSESTF